MFDPFFSLLLLAAIVALVWALIHWSSPERRQSKRKGFIVLACAVVAVFGFLFYAGPHLWVSNDGRVELYVIAPEQKAKSFNDDLGRIISSYGMKPNPGKSTDAKGVTYYVMQSNANWLSLWSTNLPMDGNEDPNMCGQYRESHPDPGQYVVAINRIFPFGTDRAAQELMAKINANLKVSGYETRSEPVICSPLSKSQAPD